MLLPVHHWSCEPVAESLPSLSSAFLNRFTMNFTSGDFPITFTVDTHARNPDDLIHKTQEGVRWWTRRGGNFSSPKMLLFIMLETEY
jgi:hypothetical protein